MARYLNHELGQFNMSPKSKSKQRAPVNGGDQGRGTRLLLFVGKGGHGVCHRFSSYTDVRENGLWPSNQEYPADI